MKKFLPVLLIVILISIATFAIFSKNNSQKESDTIVIVSTIGMISDIVENIAGDNVTIQTITGPDVDPHTYKPTAGDVKRLRDADIIFYNGLNLEAQMTNLFEEMKEKSYAVSTDIPEESLLPWEFDTNEEGYDPHVWNDVSNWIIATETVSRHIQDKDPQHAETYKKNTERYIARLRDLDRYAREQIATIPRENRYLVTGHDAYGYFSRAYDIDVQGLMGVSTESEASVKDVQELATFISDNRIPAIFVENIIPEKTMKAVQDAVTQRGHNVKIGGTLYSDALGNPGSSADTYEGMIRHNVDTIVSGLTDSTGSNEQ